MSEPYVPVPDPEPDAHRDPLPARCPFCFLLVRRISLDDWFCPDHGTVRPYYYYGDPREDESDETKPQ